MKRYNYFMILILTTLISYSMEEPKKGTKRIFEEEEIMLAEPEVGQETEPIELQPEPTKIAKAEKPVAFGRLPLEALPTELQAMIIKALESVPLSTEPAQLFIAANNIRNLLMSHPAFKGFLEEPSFTRILIKELADRYAGGDLIQVAIALGTDAASVWINANANAGLNFLHLLEKNFFEAVARNQIGVVNFLFAHLMDQYRQGLLNHTWTNVRYKATPLCIAVEKGYIPMVKKLLALGADVNLANEHERTPLWLAFLWRVGNCETIIRCSWHRCK